MKSMGNSLSGVDPMAVAKMAAEGGLNKTPLAAAKAVQATNPAPMQQDGNQNVMPPKPTKAGLESRSGSPRGMNSSGIENAMGALADKTHPVRGR